jgi:type I restriction enzyme S subunit
MRDLFTRGLRGEPQKETEIGPVPEGWEIRDFHETVLLQRGFDLPVSARREGHVVVFGSNGSVGTHNDSPAAVPVPTVMVGRSGSIGRASYSDQPCWPLNTTMYVADFRGNNPKYVYYWLQHFDLSRFGQGVSVPTLNRNTFANVKVSVPTSNEQREIVAILDAIDRKIELHRKKCAVLEELFKALLHKLMTGEIRVADLDLAALDRADTAAAMAEKEVV